MIAMSDMTEKTAVDEKDRLVIPLDLTEWVRKEVLSRWLVQKIDALNWTNPELVEYLKRHPEYRPQGLLTVLTLAYATGVYASEDIEALCFKEEPFRSVAGKDIPTIPQIRRFRRENRGLLKWLLAETLKKALREKYALGDTLLPPGLRRYLQELAVERLNLARHMDHSSSEGM